jgi:predicted ribosomally synthesized peptide with nif11-like leader
MATQDFVKFYNEYLPQNPELKSKVEAITNEQEFAKTVLDLGAKGGFKFTEQEVEQVMGASEKVALGSELSDAQLDNVAGGAVGNMSLQTVQIAPISQQNLVNRAKIDLGSVGSTIMCCW